MNKLEKFHLECTDEYNQILNYFNIMFYGFGCKKEILKRLFPEGTILNCNTLKIKEISDEIKRVAAKKVSKKELSILKKYEYPEIIEKLDNILQKNDEKILLIFINFDFEALYEFNSKSSFQIIGTIETMNPNFSYDDLNIFNFIFRDLTTYKPYLEEIANMEFKSNNSKYKTLLSVINNVSKKSRSVFCAILEEFEDKDKMILNDIYEKIKRKFLLSSVKAFSSLIIEFYDHGILKLSDGTIYLNLSLEERSKFKIEANDKKNI